MGIRDGVKNIIYRPYFYEYKKNLRESLIERAAYIEKYGCVSKCKELGLEFENTEDVFLLRGDEVIMPCDISDKETHDILKRFKAFFLLHPDYDIAYSDELKNGEVLIKPDWSPDRYKYEDYLGTIIAVRRDYYEALIVDGSRRITRGDYLFNASGFERKGYCRIGHLDEPLDFSPFEKDFQGVLKSEKRIPSDNQNTLSIIIPSKDNPGLLTSCLNSILDEINDGLTEVVVVDNGSTDENKKKICDYLEALPIKCKYVYDPMPFNFAHMCNKGAGVSAGKMLLFLNDDIEAVPASKGFIGELKALAGNGYSGAAGIKLLYPEGENGKNIIQHIGIQAIPSGPVHRLQYLSDEKVHYDNRNRGIHNCLAVTGACLMIRQSVFRKMNGFSENLAVAFNDVDLCYRLSEAGYYNVVLCDKFLLHHESITRGKDTSEEKLNRLNREYLKLTRLHFDKIKSDPYYSKWLQQSALITDIKPLEKRHYEDGDVQIITQMPKILTKEEFDGKVKASKGKLRDDACIYSKLLYNDEKEIYGFATLLGSKNYTQKKSILLMKLTDDKKEVENVVEIPMLPFYGELVEVDRKEFGEMSTFRMDISGLKLNGNYIFGAKSVNALGGAGVYHMTEQIVKFMAE